MEGNGEVRQVQSIKILIEFVPSRAVNVTLDPPQALGDKFLCYAALEGARDAIKDFNDKQAANQSGIVPVAAMPIIHRRG